MRGEDVTPFSKIARSTGSPPHARGRPTAASGDVVKLGITPACAGKTEWRNFSLAKNSGSPPHARGRHRRQTQFRFRNGITPACAGKTDDDIRHAYRGGDHPRMRGEDITPMHRERAPAGSPPHARGRLKKRHFLLNVARITPACAGKTLPLSLSCNKYRDHPRMRGEDNGSIFPMSDGVGSPPHARGRLVIT